jgi:hypothetical protein
MELRSSDDLRASYARLSATLDEAVRLATHSLGDPDAKVVDHSNRSGFDTSGFLHFSYDVKVESRRNGTQVEKATVWLSFVEPLGQEEEAEIQVLAVAERFQLGEPSSVLKRSGPRKWRASEVPPPGALASEIVQMLRTSWEQLASASRGG